MMMMMRWDHQQMDYSLDYWYRIRFYFRWEHWVVRLIREILWLNVCFGCMFERYIRLFCDYGIWYMCSGFDLILLCFLFCLKFEKSLLFFKSGICLKIKLQVTVKMGYFKSSRVFIYIVGHWNSLMDAFRALRVFGCQMTFVIDWKVAYEIQSVFPNYLGIQDGVGSFRQGQAQSESIKFKEKNNSQNFGWFLILNYKAFRMTDFK